MPLRLGHDTLGDLMILPPLLHNRIPATFPTGIGILILLFFVFTGIAISGTPIQQDPKGFFDITWGDPLANRSELKEIDVSNILKIYTL